MTSTLVPFMAGIIVEPKQILHVLPRTTQVYMQLQTKYSLFRFSSEPSCLLWKYPSSVYSELKNRKKTYIYTYAASTAFKCSPATLSTNHDN
jgi:hypothetical protein